MDWDTVLCPESRSQLLAIRSRIDPNICIKNPFRRSEDVTVLVANALHQCFRSSISPDFATFILPGPTVLESCVCGLHVNVLLNFRPGHSRGM
jgi:hypothetical protein